MHKEIWVKIDPWDKKLVTTALEGGADALILPPGCADLAHALGRVKVVAPDGDLKLGTDVIIHTIASAEDEDTILRLTREAVVIVKTSDWAIIPLENLVAKGAHILVFARDKDEAKTALTILEQGVSGVVLEINDAGALKTTLSALKGDATSILLETAKVKKVTILGMGDRVCVDTCTNFEAGEGILVGNSSQAMFLVHAESIENPYVATRPFRVNAGAVHAYVRVPGQRTRYLSELKAGDEVLAVNHSGEAYPVVIGRVKVERRPLLLVEVEKDETEYTHILQNAETIRLTRPNGEPISVVQLQEGDEVLVAIEKAGRHFGFKVDESIIER